MDYLFLIALAPVIFLLNYINKKDPSPEPEKLREKIFFWGCGSTVVAMILEALVGNYVTNDGLFQFFSATPSDLTYFPAILATTFLSVALIEEFVKWLVVYFITWQHREFDQPYDAIVYCVYSSLGFAAVENVIYVVFYGFGTGIVRGLTAVPSHACDAVLMGYFYGLAKKHQQDGSAPFFLFLSLIIPSLEHALYDGLLTAYASTENPLYDIIWVLSVVFIFALSLLIVNLSSKNSATFSREDPAQPIPRSTSPPRPHASLPHYNFCPRCGAKMGNFCPKCGFKNPNSML